METEPKTQTEKLLELIAQRETELKALREYLVAHAEDLNGAEVDPYMILNLCIHRAPNPKALAKALGGTWRREILYSDSYMYKSQIEVGRTSIDVTIFNAEKVEPSELVL